MFQYLELQIVKPNSQRYFDDHLRRIASCRSDLLSGERLQNRPTDLDVLSCFGNTRLSLVALDSRATPSKISVLA